MLMYLERLRGVRFYSALLFSAIVLGGALAQAANTIDPNSTGATDVVQDPFGTPITLTNPLADPLDLGLHTLAVGNIDQWGATHRQWQQSFQQRCLRWPLLRLDGRGDDHRRRLPVDQ